MFAFSTAIELSRRLEPVDSALAPACLLLGLAGRMICIEGDEAPGDGPSLQERFAAMRARRCKAAARVKAAELAQVNKRSESEKRALRAKFVEQVRSYVGTPYSASRCGHGAPLYLDCCGLVRQALTDLKEDFGFEAGPWNQSYLFDTLPAAVDPERMQPGDLVFWQAEYDDPQRKKQRHNLVHVEVFDPKALAPDGTVGSRYEGAATVGVGVHDSYRSFGGHGAHDHVLLFRSIDTWLDGVCVSQCSECSWGEQRGGGKSRLFSAEEDIDAES